MREDTRSSGAAGCCNDEGRDGRNREARGTRGRVTGEGKARQSVTNASTSTMIQVIICTNDKAKDSIGQHTRRQGSRSRSHVGARNLGFATSGRSSTGHAPRCR